MITLTLLFAQPWAERLAWTLLHFLWQAAAIAALLVAVRRLTADARSRYVGACLALALMLAAPIPTFLWLGSGDASSAPVAPPLAASPAPAGGADITRARRCRVCCLGS